MGIDWDTERMAREDRVYSGALSTGAPTRSTR